MWNQIHARRPKGNELGEGVGEGVVVGEGGKGTVVVVVDSRQIRKRETKARHAHRGG